MKRTLLIALAVFGFGMTQAQTRTPVLNARQANQQHRINRGIRSGALTPAEAGRLEYRQARLQRAENIAKADGYVTACERARLQSIAANNSRVIYNQKHDYQRMR